MKEFGRVAEENGGGCYRVDMGVPEDQMYGLEVQDPDGNMLEPLWMLASSQTCSTGPAQARWRFIGAEQA